MGFGRKVGAFLGLVPDDGRGPEYDGDYPASYAADRSDQYDDFEGAEYAGEFGRDYGTEYSPSRAGSHPVSAQVGDSYPEQGYSTERTSERYVRAESGRAEGGRAESGFASEPVVQGALAMQPVVAPRSHPDTKSGNRPVTIKLTGFAEARVIGEKYRDGQSVIMDMTEMADADARRLVDFAAGLAFAKRGSIDKVTTKVFMLLPSDIDASDISAEQRREYAGSYGR